MKASECGKDDSDAFSFTVLSPVSAYLRGFLTTFFVFLRAADFRTLETPSTLISSALALRIFSACWTREAFIS